MQPRDLSGHTAYEAGRGDEEVARELGLDPDDLVTLSSNENPHGPSPKAVAAIREAATEINTYPKAVQADLVGALSERWDLAPKQVWLGNGGDGALDYLARAFLDPGDQVLVSEPGFAYYAMSARYHHGRVNTYELSKAEEFAQTPERILSAYDGERIVYLTTPHNPTGAEIDLEGIERVAAETHPETLVVVDEAYAEFTQAESARTLIEGRTGYEGRADGEDGGKPSTREDVAVLRTFSKAYGLAGVRLGYALVPEAWADAYARVNTPFAASTVACRAGLAALSDTEHVERTISTARWAREYIHDHLDAHTWPSGGNFVLADVGDGTTDAAAVTDAATVTDAASQRGILVRDCTSFGLPDCVRITCGTRETTRRAVSVLNEVLAG